MQPDIIIRSNEVTFNGHFIFIHLLSCSFNCTSALMIGNAAGCDYVSWILKINMLSSICLDAALWSLYVKFTDGNASGCHYMKLIWTTYHGWMSNGHAGRWWPQYPCISRLDRCPTMQEWINETNWRRTSEAEITMHCHTNDMDDKSAVSAVSCHICSHEIIVIWQ